MLIKRIIEPARLRRIPAHFSWVDHRLVQDRHIERCDPYAAALYLFLVTVGDAQGLSYYSDNSLAERLSIALGRLSQSRDDLIRAGLIAYERPLYQVLALDSPIPQGGQAQATGIQARLLRLHEIVGRRLP